MGDLGSLHLLRKLLKHEVKILALEAEAYLLLVSEQETLSLAEVFSGDKGIGFDEAVFFLLELLRAGFHDQVLPFFEGKHQVLQFRSKVIMQRPMGRIISQRKGFIEKLGDSVLVLIQHQVLQIRKAQL